MFFFCLNSINRTVLIYVFKIYLFMSNYKLQEMFLGRRIAKNNIVLLLKLVYETKNIFLRWTSTTYENTYYRIL